MGCWFAICCVPRACLLEMFLFIGLYGVAYRVRSLLYIRELWKRHCAAPLLEPALLSYFILVLTKKLVTAHESFI
jgi:hypothetical protein